jgi:hypothetical protein
MPIETLSIPEGIPIFSRLENNCFEDQVTSSWCFVPRIEIPLG